MTTSLTPNPSDVLGEGPVPFETLVFYQQDLRHVVHDALLIEFDKQEAAGRITKSKLAERIRKAKEQVTRWLAVPTNLTLDTLSDLLLGMGKRLEIRIVDFNDAAPALHSVPQSPTKFDFPDADVSRMRVEVRSPDYDDSTYGDLGYILH